MPGFIGSGVVAVQTPCSFFCMSSRASAAAARRRGRRSGGRRCGGLADAGDEDLLGIGRAQTEGDLAVGSHLRRHDGGHATGRGRWSGRGRCGGWLGQRARRRGDEDEEGGSQFHGRLLVDVRPVQAVILHPCRGAAPDGCHGPSLGTVHFKTVSSGPVPVSSPAHVEAMRTGWHAFSTPPVGAGRSSSATRGPAHGRQASGCRRLR